jgi:general secretion pathway protein K
VKRPRARRAERGVALLLVLWIFMVLGVLALDFARFVRDDAMAAVNLADETRGYYVALAGINTAIFEVQRAREEATTPEPAAEEASTLDEDKHEKRVPPDGAWHESTFGEARYAVRMLDEGGRIALNKADDALLTQVVTTLMQGGNRTTGLSKRDLDAIAEVVDGILDWRDPDDDLVRMHGAEDEYYLGLRRPYRAKNGWFDALEELLLVRGVTPALYYGDGGLPGLRDIVSVYSRSTKVNIRTAPPAVLQVLLGVDAATLSDLVALRDADPDAFLPLAQAAAMAVDPRLVLMLDSDPNPTVVTLEAKADLRDPRNQSRVAVVADLSAETAEGAKVIRWLDRAPWSGPPPGGERAAS